MLTTLLSEFAPYIIGLLALIGGAGAAYFKGRGDGAATAENAILKTEVAAKEEQLEMNREATKAEREAAAMTEEKARQEAMKWAKR